MSSERERTKVGHRVVAIDFGAELSHDAKRIIKRLHDLTAVVQIEASTQHGEVILIRPVDLNMDGVSSSHHASEEEALRALAGRAPTLKVKRHSRAEIMSLGELYRVSSSFVPQPLPYPKIGGDEVPVKGIGWRPSVVIENASAANDARI